jgi:hypothetical protein
MWETDYAERNKYYIKFRIVFWDVLACKITVDRRFRGTYCLHHPSSSGMMEAVRTSETSVDNYFTLQYIPEDNPELHTRRRENFKSHKVLYYFTLSVYSCKGGTK